MPSPIPQSVVPLLFGLLWHLRCLAESGPRSLPHTQDAHPTHAAAQALMNAKPSPSTHTRTDTQTDTHAHACNARTHTQTHTNLQHTHSQELQRAETDVHVRVIHTHTHANNAHTQTHIYTHPNSLTHATRANRAHGCLLCCGALALLLLPALVVPQRTGSWATRPWRPLTAPTGSCCAGGPSWRRGTTRARPPSTPCCRM